MTRPDALDYSWGRPSPAALKAAGIQLVARYLSHDDSKDLSIAEVSALHTAGIGVLLNWESDAGRPLLGATAGTADGRDAAARAESRGAPHGLTIYYSTDRDTQPSQWPTIAAYYRAAGQATAGRYKVGVYGEADLIDYLHKQGVVTSEWQTYAWSNGRLSAEADLFQYLNGQTLGGASVDFNRIIHPALLGAWWPNGETPLGGGVPLTPPEVDMDDEGLQQGLRKFFASQEGHDRVMAAARDADIRPEVATAVTAAANLAVRQVLGSKEGQDRISQALMDELAALKAAMPTAAELATAVQAVLPAGSTVDPHALAQAVLDLFATKLGA